MYDAILYPTDGSSTAEAALEHARNQAERHGAAVHVLYVVDVGQRASGWPATSTWGAPPGWSAHRAATGRE